MKPVNIGGHAAYRNALRDCLHACYPALSVITKSQWKIYEKFRDLDLSAIDSIMEDKYSVFSPEPRPPSCMFRSYLLSPTSDFPSVTAWVEAMRVTPFYAILSGFEPGVGTFYDFFNRLWDGPEKNLANYIQPPRAKVKKPKGKGQKADGVETETTEELLHGLFPRRTAIRHPFRHLSGLFAEPVRFARRHSYRKPDPFGRRNACRHRRDGTRP